MMRAPAMRPMDAAAARGALGLQHCAACGTIQYPPREICRNCLSDHLDWTEAPCESGEVLAATTLHHSHDPAFRARLPLRVGIVRLDRGATVICFLAPAAAAGARVTLRASLDQQGRAILTAEYTS